MNRMLLMVLAGLLVGGFLLVSVTRCGPSPTPEPPTRRTGERSFTGTVPDDVDAAAIGAPMPTRFTDRLRLVSLSPAMSRTLVDMGLEASIIGRSGFCDFLDPAIPVAGDLLRVDAERIIALEPTHVLRQPPARDDSSGLRRLASERGWAPPITARLDGIPDVRAFVRRLPSQLADPLSPMEASLEARAQAIDARLAALVEPPADAEFVPSPATPESLGGGVLLVHAIRPPGVFGRRTYLDDMLTARGLENAFNGLGWRTIGTEDLIRLDPAAIILVTDQPAGAADFLAEAQATWAGLGLRAVDGGRLVVLGHPDALRPCTGLIGVGAALDRALGAAVTGGGGDGASGGGGRTGRASAGDRPGGGELVLPVAPGDRIGPVGGGVMGGDR
jgi:ABC-type hemin transport system substrate-binding protein